MATTQRSLTVAEAVLGIAITVGTLLVLGGATYGSMSNRLSNVETSATKWQTDHDTLLEMKGDIRAIKQGVDDIRSKR